jgi:4-amino-4-deoxy-L-arabinose transferase-like glycosyltransferase
MCWQLLDKNNVKRSVGLELVLLAVLLVGALFLCSYRLETYPAPWFDEGLGFQPAKNFVFYGEYGLRSSEGFQSFHPAIQTGPTVLLPIALVFRVFGFGILQARSIIVIYSILAMLSFYALIRSTCNRWVALLASLLLISTFDHEFTSFIFMSRQVLAEVDLARFALGIGHAHQGPICPYASGSTDHLLAVRPGIE